MILPTLQEAAERLEILYWDFQRNGGPDIEVLAILRLCQEAVRQLRPIEGTDESADQPVIVGPQGETTP